MVVAVEAAVLAGLSDEPGLVLGEGWGQPVSVEDVLRAAFEATWQVALVDAGRLVGLCPDIRDPGVWPAHVMASKGYKPSGRLKALVAVKDQACVGCGAPASRCELDHRLAYPDGLTTGLNLQLLCKRCHELKTRHGWDHSHDPATGVTTIQTPSGHRTDIPAPLLL
jgi:NAD-dependent dihydropyrimidine dehydrogenase PreA subunit